MHAKTWCYVGIDAARKWALCRRVQIAAASSGFTRENGEAAASLPACPAQLPRATSQPAASGHTSYRKATGKAGKPCSVRHRWHALVGMS